MQRRIQETAPYDSVVSDAAPSTTGNRTMDTARSLDIARQVLAICETSLAPGGSCLLKIFQGGGEKEILDRMRSLFRASRAFKPKASRSDSMETYYFATGFHTGGRVSARGLAAGDPGHAELGKLFRADLAADALAAEDRGFSPASEPQALRVVTFSVSRRSS